MNPTPHMHEVTIDSYCDGNSQKIKYGDTRVIVHAFCFGKLPSSWRISRAVKKAVKRHDKGSRKHAAYQAHIQNVNQHVERKREVIGHHTNGDPIYSTYYHEVVGPQAWGSELMRGRVDA